MKDQESAKITQKKVRETFSLPEDERDKLKTVVRAEILPRDFFQTL